MIEPVRLSFGAFPAFEPLPAIGRPTPPANGQQAAFETVLEPPAEEEALRLGSPPSNLLPFPFDPTKSMGDRIIDAFERMRQSVGLPPPAAELPEVPDPDPDPETPPVGEAPPAVVESVVVENGVPLEIERPDGRVVTITFNGDGSAVVETLEDGSTVVRAADGGTASISASFSPSVSFSVADGDRILASLAQMRAEIL